MIWMDEFLENTSKIAIYIHHFLLGCVLGHLHLFAAATCQCQDILAMKLLDRAIQQNTALSAVFDVDGLQRPVRRSFVQGSEASFKAASTSSRSLWR